MPVRLGALFLPGIEVRELWRLLGIRPPSWKSFSLLFLSGSFIEIPLNINLMLAVQVMQPLRVRGVALVTFQIGKLSPLSTNDQNDVFSVNKDHSVSESA